MCAWHVGGNHELWQAGKPPRYNNSTPMAAQLNPAPDRPPEIVDLRRLTALDLEPLLNEETAAWRDSLDWDFTKSAELVLRFVDLHALTGFALLENGEVTGYLYYVLEENKGLIGDLYIARGRRGAGYQHRLVAAALDAIMPGSGVTRIEAQLLMLERTPHEALPHAQYLSTFERNFMQVDLSRASIGRGRRSAWTRMHIESWSDRHYEAAARLITVAYQGHIDSRINDQYRTVGGARRFLFNIVQYPGCGTFHRAASFVAVEPEQGELCGISLASLVAPDCGHITQICVSPTVRGTGTGYELLRRSLTALQDAGCKSTSLTVTAANEDAVALYERVGFRTIRSFPACVWQGF
jgi:ribosomal protein S18 acetylase RimI-like enzyme